MMIDLLMTDITCLNCEEQKHLNYEWAVKLNRICLKILGIWPKNNETKREKLMLNLYVFVLINIELWFCLVPTVHSLFKFWGNLMLIIDNLQYVLPIAISIVKFSIIWQKKEDILPLLNMIKYDWLKSKTTQERNIMIKRAKFASMITTFEYFMMLLSYIFFSVFPVFGITLRYLPNGTDPGRMMPIQMYYFDGRNKSPFYEIFVAMQIIGMSICATAYSSIDCFLNLLVFHMCGQLENLKMRINTLDKFNNFEGNLAHSVRDHMRLIRSIYMIDDIFTLMLLGALIYFGVIFAFYGFLISTLLTQHGNIPILRLTYMVTVFLTLFGHTCLYCFVGENLVTQYEGVYDAVYEFKWYTLEPKKVRNLLIIMIYANKPLYLTAGKLFPMTMTTLCNLLKTSSGYISVLLAHRE